MKTPMVALAATWLLLLIGWACASSSGGRALPGLLPGVVVMREENFYDVTGRNVREIGTSLRNSASAALGGSITGRHSWDIRWNYRYQEYDEGCEITEVTIDMNSTIDLPRWLDRDSADPELVAQWDRYLADLRSHEHCHRVLAYRTGNELSRTVSRIRSFTCGELRNDVQVAGRTIMADFNALNAEYDLASMGLIRWPPTEEERELPACPVGRRSR